MQEARRPQPGALSDEDSENSKDKKNSKDHGTGENGADPEGGLGPTVALLVVSLAAAAVGVHLLSGFGLHSLDPRPRLFRAGLATAGVIVAIVVAGAAAGNLTWLLAVSRRRTTAGGTPSVKGRASVRKRAPVDG